MGLDPLTLRLFILGIFLLESGVTASEERCAPRSPQREPLIITSRSQSRLAAFSNEPALRSENVPTVSGLVVESLGPHYSPDPRRTVVQQSRSDAGGSTSIRHIDAAHLDWKVQGYFQRNRDLGQVFTAPRNFTLDAVVIRTGPSDAAVGAGAPGARVLVEFFEVLGAPILDDNGTPPGSDATHGFSKNHRCDDFIRGVEYHPLLVVLGGVFPDLPPTRTVTNDPTGDSAGKRIFLRWRFSGSARLQLEAGKRYAMLFGFEEPGKARTFTLANANAAGIDAPPRLGDRHDAYPEGWGIRREADGTRPPIMTPGPQPPTDLAILRQLLQQSVFPEGPARFLVPPETDGYPDVDTYRDLEFYLETAIP